MKKVTILLAVLLAATLISGCSGNVPVKITNDLGAWDIDEILIDPSDAAWGENRITEVLTADEDVTIYVPAGTYDIKIVDEDSDSYTRWNIEIGTNGYEWSVTLDDID